MIERHHLPLAALLAFAAVVAGCSTTLGGAPVAASVVGYPPSASRPLPVPTSEMIPLVSPPSSGAAPATSAMGGPIPTASAPTNSISGPQTEFAACPSVAATDSAGIVACLRRSVSEFWSGQLKQVIDQPVVVDPTIGQVPADCQADVTNSQAFTCRLNDTVYISKALVTQLGEQFGAPQVPYALAAVISHEIGHVVQGAVNQPGYDDPDKSNAVSQQIEQQADCLSGVWAHSEISQGKIDRAAFVTVTGALITSISTSDEIITHGTPTQRAAVLAKGLASGRPKDCELATFS